MNGTHPDDDRLIAYALNELEAPEREKIESHCAACRDCARMVAALSGAIEHHRVSLEADAPTGVLVELLQAQAASRARQRSGLWWRFPLATAAVVVALAIVFLTGFWAGRLSTPTMIGSPAAERGAVLRYPLPEPPDVPFRTVRSTDSI